MEAPHRANSLRHHQRTDGPPASPGQQEILGLGLPVGHVVDAHHERTRAARQPTDQHSPESDMLDEDGEGLGIAGVVMVSPRASRASAGRGSRHPGPETRNSRGTALRSWVHGAMDSGVCGEGRRRAPSPSCTPRSPSGITAAVDSSRDLNEGQLCTDNENGWPVPSPAWTQAWSSSGVLHGHSPARPRPQPTALA